MIAKSKQFDSLEDPVSGERESERESECVCERGRDTKAMNAYINITHA